MKHGSLFSGIGGFDLAAQWMGWDNVFHCDINAFCQKILKHYWPFADSLENIKNTNFEKYKGQIDIISGGFPCQPYSVAGQRKGTEDDRHLWPEMLRAIREIKPRWIVGENVYGLVNWNGGLVFEEIHADLEAEGYEVWATILPAVSKDAPHRRDRIWFVAYSDAARLERCSRNGLSGNIRRFANKNNERAFTNADYSRLERSENERGFTRIRQRCNQQFTRCFQSNWEDFPTQSPICSGNDGISPKLDGITFSKWRNESIKGYGNAVVPQVVYEIFKVIELLDKKMI